MTHLVISSKWSLETTRQIAIAPIYFQR